MIIIYRIIGLCICFSSHAYCYSQTASDYYFPDYPLNTKVMGRQAKTFAESDQTIIIEYSDRKDGWLVAKSIRIKDVGIVREWLLKLETTDKDIILKNIKSKGMIGPSTDIDYTEDYVLFRLPGKKRPSIWSYTDKLGTYDCTANFCPVNVDGESKDAVRVVKQGKAGSREWVETEFYVAGMGIYKSGFTSNPSDTSNFDIIKSLNTDPEIYSYRRNTDQIHKFKANQKRIEVEAEAEALAVREEKRQFLKSRASTTYSLQTYDTLLYSSITDTLKAKLLRAEPLVEEGQYNGQAVVAIDTDTSGGATYRFELVPPEQSLTMQFEKVMDSYSPPPVVTRGYYMKSHYKKKLTVDQSTYVFDYSYPSKNLIAVDSSNTNWVDDDVQVNRELEALNYAPGSYVLRASTLSVEGTSRRATTPLSYTTRSGPGAALLSAFTPGLGNYLVNGKRGSIIGQNAAPWITTLTAFALVGAGVALKMDSKSKQADYRIATDQKDIDQLYDQANSRHISSLSLFGVAGGIWAVDFAWTLSKGLKNSRNKKRMNQIINNL